MILPSGAVANLKGKRNINRYKLFFMALPFLALTFVFSYMPLYGWLYAFYNYRPGIPLKETEFVGFQWFSSIVSNPTQTAEVMRVFTNTIAMSTLGIITSILPVAFAIFLVEVKSGWFRKIVQILTTLPNFISWVLVYSVSKRLVYENFKFYFKANQMGLVDPDSISQKFEDVQNKYKDGQVLFCWFPWLDSMYNTNERQAEGKGFALVPVKDQKIISYGFDQRGGNRIISIGAKAEKPDRIMELINWMYTNEGVMTTYNGPEDLSWELKDGKPVLTEFGKKALPNNPEEVPAEYGGGNFKDGFNQMNFEQVNRNATNLDTKEAYDYRLWTSYLQANATKLVQNWRTAMGALTPKEYVVKNNLYSVKMPVFMGKAAETRSDMLIQKQGQVSTVIKQYSWKLIFAKDEKQFNQLVEEMTNKAKGLGYDEVVTWNKAHAKEVYEFLKNEK